MIKQGRTTYAFGGLGERSTFFKARMSSAGSAQCSRGFSPGTERLSSCGVKESERAVALAARRAVAATERNFIVVVCWGGRDVYVEVVVVQRDEGKSSLGRRCGCAFGDAEACGDATTELGSLTARTVL